MLAARITSMDDITSWQQVEVKTRRRQSQQHTPLHVITPPPPPPLPHTVPCDSSASNPASVWVHESSMARGVAAHDDVNATGSVRGAATVVRLTSQMKKDSQIMVPHMLCYLRIRTTSPMVTASAILKTKQEDYFKQQDLLSLLLQ